jgi:hypothetical protein
LKRTSLRRWFWREDQNRVISYVLFWFLIFCVFWKSSMFRKNSGKKYADEVYDCTIDTSWRNRELVQVLQCGWLFCLLAVQWFCSWACGPKMENERCHNFHLLGTVHMSVPIFEFKNVAESPHYLVWKKLVTQMRFNKR